MITGTKVPCLFISLSIASSKNLTQTPINAETVAGHPEKSFSAENNFLPDKCSWFNTILYLNLEITTLNCRIESQWLRFRNDNTSCKPSEKLAVDHSCYATFIRGKYFVH